MDLQHLPNQLPDITAGPPDLIVLVAMLGVGVTLWAAGAKIAKVMCASTGLLAGAALAVVFTPEGKDLPTVLLLTAAGAIGGILLGLVLFRLWVAISCAAVFAALAPAAMLLWQAHTGQLPPAEPLNAPTQEAIELAFDVLAIADDLAPLSDHGHPPEGGSADTASILQNTRTWYRAHVQNIRRTWVELGQQPKWVTIAATIVAGLIGLAIGLIGPNVAAAAQSSVVGSGLMVVAAEQVVGMATDTPPAWWPQVPETRLAVFIGLAALGVGIQLLITRRERDD